MSNIYMNTDGFSAKTVAAIAKEVVYKVRNCFAESLLDIYIIFHRLGDQHTIYTW